MAPRLLDILRLGRVHSSMATAALPALGYIAAGGGLPGIFFIIIGGILHHAWGFSMNEIVDLDVDKGNRDLKDKPLVSGRISVRSARNISRLFLVMSISSFIAGSLITGGDPFLILGALFLSTMFGAIYNLLGKKIPMMDITIALWMTFLVLTGALASGKGPDIGSPVIAVMVLGTLQILFNNSVEGGLKDVENDRDSDVRTLAVITGAVLKKGELRPGKVIKWWGRGLRAASVISGSVLSLLIMDAEGWGEWVVIAVAVLGIVIFTHSLGFLSDRSLISRKDLLKKFAVHEVMTFGFLIAVILPAVGPIWGILLFLVPFGWFALFNRILFNTSLAPKV